MPKGKRADILIMNPPYAGNLHLKFLDKTIEISKNVISIQPDVWLNKSKINTTKCFSFEIIDTELLNKTGGVVPTVPIPFEGHPIEDFVLKEEVINNLTSTKTNVPLSAYQGKILNNAIEEHTSDISSINGDVSTLKTDVGSLKTDVGSSKTDTT